jgi:hypothetical protein
MGPQTGAEYAENRVYRVDAHAEWQSHGEEKLKEYQIPEILLDASITVHKTFGSGLLESVYQRALCIELRERRLRLQSELPVEVTYNPSGLGGGRRAAALAADSATLDRLPVRQTSAS